MCTQAAGAYGNRVFANWKVVSLVDFSGVLFNVIPDI